MKGLEGLPEGLEGLPEGLEGLLEGRPEVSMDTIFRIFFWNIGGV